MGKTAKTGDSKETETKMEKRKKRRQIPKRRNAKPRAKNIANIKLAQMETK